MTVHPVALRSFRHDWRMHLRVILGAALTALGLITTLHAQDLSRIPPAEKEKAALLLKTYRESPDFAAREQAVQAITKMHYTVMHALIPILERDWQLAVTSYRAGIQRTAAEVARKRLADPAIAKEVRTLRAAMAKLRATEPSKEQLAGEGDAAIKRLREIHTLALADIVALQPALGPMGDFARAITRMRVTLKSKTILKNPIDFTEADLAREEAATLSGSFRTNSAVERVLEANAKLAEKKEIPADEAEGVRDLNEMRMLLGLAPSLIDPKLHNAARDHSKDMATLKFFAHDSPVAGKKTPWDRAKLAKTTASGECIFAGSTRPADANRGWFLSPGHHMGMFGDNNKRVGLGRYEGHWTLLIGG